MAERQDPHRMVKVRFPARFGADGKVIDPPRDKYLPYSQATSPHVKVLGVTLLSDIDEGLAPDPHKTAAQTEADALRKQLEEAQRTIAELSKKEKPKAKADAGQA